MLGSITLGEDFDEHLNFGRTHTPKTWKCLCESSIISQFLDFIHRMVFDFILPFVTV